MLERSRFPSNRRDYDQTPGWLDFVGAIPIQVCERSHRWRRQGPDWDNQGQYYPPITECPLCSEENTSPVKEGGLIPRDVLDQYTIADKVAKVKELVSQGMMVYNACRMVALAPITYYDSIRGGRMRYGVFVPIKKRRRR